MLKKLLSFLGRTSSKDICSLYWSKQDKGRSQRSNQGEGCRLDPLVEARRKTDSEYHTDVRTVRSPGGKLLEASATSSPPQVRPAVFTSERARILFIRQQPTLYCIPAGAAGAGAGAGAAALPRPGGWAASVVPPPSSGLPLGMPRTSKPATLLPAIRDVEVGEQEIWKGVERVIPYVRFRTGA